jgi:hypothetical protein
MASLDFTNIVPRLDATVAVLTKFPLYFLTEPDLEIFKNAKKTRAKDVPKKERPTVVAKRQLLQATWDLDPDLYFVVVYTGLENLVTLPDASDVSRFVRPFTQCLAQWASDTILPNTLPSIIERYRDYFPSGASKYNIRLYLSQIDLDGLVTVS